MAQELQKKITFDYARVGGINLHYATAGNGEKLVLLLHGFPEFWYSWRHQLADLSDEYTVVAPDMRGYNLSAKPKNVADYEMDNLVDDVTGLIRHFGREQAAVIGHDWGAAVAWAVGLKHPEYVWKLAALQVPPPAVWRKNQTLRQLLKSWYMFFFQIPRLPEWLLSLSDYQGLANGLRTSTAMPDVFSNEVIAEYKKAWSEPGALRSAINYYRANFVKRFLTNAPEIVKIKIPTLFIFGEKDAAILPETVSGVGDVIDAEFKEVRIPDAGHWVQQEAREVVSKTLREFLSE